MKKTILAIAVAAASAAATADYQGEVGVAYGQGEANSTDNDVVAFGGRYNFEMVDTSKGPQAEAAFLDKSSSAGLYYLSTEPDAAGADDEDDIGVDVRVVTADNLIIEAAYSQFDDGSDDADTVSIGVGTYLNDTTDIVVTYSTTDADLVDIDALNLDLHSVMKLQGTASLAYDLGASYIDAEDDDGYTLAAGATYYIDNNLGFSLAYDILDVDVYDTNTLSIGVSYFPMPEVELEINYFDQGGDDEADGILLGAAVRF
ncbi:MULTISPECIES: putative porin [Spongiibacter]|uniref:putative porin n=2 Tax=Spongiibacteraceae TaxID=1706375 RepID=UPI000C61C87A|nr:MULTISPECIES: putative porin [Spongiibacter]MAY39732.1 hypothetical protein [Spongiibacter sp.]|tara:strand:+ start:67 stop:843 length:777 start_codon:yes stop_codon:yes gene_type:complete